MVLTKADTLDYLKNRIAKSRIEDLMIVTGKIFERTGNRSLQIFSRNLKDRRSLFEAPVPMKIPPRHQMRVIMTVYWMSTLMIAMLYVMRLRQYLILIKRSARYQE